MKLLIEQAQLVAALTVARRAFDTSSKIQIAGFARMTAADDSLTVDITDFDIMISMTVPAEVIRPGQVAAPIARLWDLTRLSPGESEISIEIEEDRLRFRCGSTKAALQILPADMFPTLDITEQDEAPVRFVGPAESWSRILGETAFAITSDESRWALYGTHLHLENGRLVAVATDGKVIARSDIAAEGLAGIPHIIIGKKTVGILSGLLEKAKGDIAMAVTERKIAFSFGTTKVVSKLVDGVFPSYQKIGAETPGATARVHRAAFGDLIARVGTFAVQRKTDQATYQYIELSFGFEEETVGVLQARSSTPDGSIRDRMVVDYAGAPMSIVVDPKSLSRALAAISGDEIALGLNGRAEPIILRDGDRDDLKIVFGTLNFMVPEHAE